MRKLEFSEVDLINGGSAGLGYMGLSAAYDNSFASDAFSFDMELAPKKPKTPPPPPPGPETKPPPEKEAPATSKTETKNTNNCSGSTTSTVITGPFGISFQMTTCTAGKIGIRSTYP